MRRKLKGDTMGHEEDSPEAPAPRTLADAFGSNRCPSDTPILAGREEINDLDWQARTRRVLRYVQDVHRRERVTDYVTIREAVERGWGLPCLEAMDPVGDMGPLCDADPELGRFGIRMNNPMRSSRFHLVVRATLSPERKTWALLHELGHVIYHAELFASLGVLFGRIAMRPDLELEVGAFLQEKGDRLITLRELEADLFAVNWLYPRRLIGGGRNNEGEQYRLLRESFGQSLPPPSSQHAQDTLNRRAAEERRRAASMDYPRHGGLYQRASWVLHHRQLLAAEENRELARLVAEYFRLVGYPPRHVPELRSMARERRAVPVDHELAWIHRIPAARAVEVVDQDNWAPVLVPFGETLPPYYIAVRPMGGRNPRDSQLRWQPLYTAAVAPPRRLEDWLERAQERSVGLLLFGRSPAERILDAMD